MDGSKVERDALGVYSPVGVIRVTLEDSNNQIKCRAQSGAHIKTD